MSSTELPERINFQLKMDPHRKKWGRLHQAVADEQGVDPDSLSRPEVVAEAAEAYLMLHRLRQDARLDEVAQAVASDHSVEPDEVSLECAIKTAAGAYNGFQRTDDWPVEREESADA